jgi:hypothetical protein
LLFYANPQTFLSTFAPKIRRERGARMAPIPLRECKMTDLLMLALGLGFFAVALAYVFACDRL